MPREKMFRVPWKTAARQKLWLGSSAEALPAVWQPRAHRGLGKGQVVRDPLLRPADATLLDLIEQGLVAHTQTLSRLAAIPMHLPERMFDRGALGFQGRSFGHRGEGSTAPLVDGVG